MSVHMLCPECGENLAEIFPAYEKVKNAYFEKMLKTHGDIDLEKVSLKNDVLPGIDFILRALYINNHCCVIHILGATDYDL